MSGQATGPGMADFLGALQVAQYIGTRDNTDNRVRLQHRQATHIIFNHYLLQFFYRHVGSHHQRPPIHVALNWGVTKTVMGRFFQVAARNNACQYSLFHHGEAAVPITKHQFPRPLHRRFRFNSPYRRGHDVPGRLHREKLLIKDDDQLFLHFVQRRSFNSSRSRLRMALAAKRRQHLCQVKMLLPAAAYNIDTVLHGHNGEYDIDIFYFYQLMGQHGQPAHIAPAVGGSDGHTHTVRLVVFGSCHHLVQDETLLFAERFVQKLVHHTHVDAYPPQLVQNGHITYCGHGISQATGILVNPQRKQGSLKRRQRQLLR
ncbi:MAG: hypothetical protein DDT35_01437 [Firmicutes bacterium]|nr:hypothetical protein [Bacillota bacterium]